VRSWGKYIGITHEAIEKTKKVFHRHKVSILLAAKVTSGLGIHVATLFTAGLTKISFRSFLFLNIVGELLWTAVLLALGYYFWHSYVAIHRLGLRITFIVVSAMLFGFLVIKINSLVRKQFKL
jgi:membrane protein DedA with SNARE-associated domain